MKLLKIAAIAAAILTHSAAHARDLMPDHIRIPLATNHVNSAKSAELNEINPGLALTWDRPWADVTAGVVRNSFGDAAPFVTLSRDLWRGDTCAAGVFFGTAHYRVLKNTTPYEMNGWIPIGGLHVECGPVFMQAMPGRGLVGSAAGKGRADAILVFGVTMHTGG